MVVRLKKQIVTEKITGQIMNFERSGDAKKTLGIGIEQYSIPITGIKGQLEVPRFRKDHDIYYIKKRWFIPLTFIIPLLNMERIPILKLVLFFKAKQERGCHPIDIFCRGILPSWIFILIRIKKLKKKNPIIEIPLQPLYNYNIRSRAENLQVFVNFIIISSDIEKARGIHKTIGNYVESMRDKDTGGFKEEPIPSKTTLRGVIYKRSKIYPVKPKSKILH